MTAPDSGPDGPLSERLAAFLEHAQLVDDFRTAELQEADTRAHLIDPVLHLLGYRSFQDIRREVTVSVTKEFLDYQLFVDGLPFAIVEAKAMRVRLTDAAAAQCVQYAAVLGGRWCLVTNGLEWRVYDAHGKGALDKKRVATVTLADGEVAAREAWDVLSLFARDAGPGAEDGRLDLLVRRAVEDELANPASGAVGELRRAIEARFAERVDSDRVVRTIRTGRTPHTLPPADLVPAEPQVMAPRVESTPRASTRVSLADLVDAGLLIEGASLEGRGGAGDRPLGVVRRDGIEVDGALYATPSMAASAVRGGTSVNGWVFWSYDGRTLASLRDQFGAAGPAV